MTRVQRVQINKSGRDFVVGDIHGAFALLEQGMREASFNPACDRLFCVGDLIDRGAESRRCVEFLALPYFRSVRGNHEQMLLDLYADGEPPETSVRWMAQRNGFEWWLGVGPQERHNILRALGGLPIVMEVATARGSVGLVHADVPDGMCWATFLAAIVAGDMASTNIALWGRDRVTRKNSDGVPGVDRIFCGHTPHWNGVHRYGNVYAIDNGAVFGALGMRADGHLTVAGLSAKTDSLLGHTLPGLVNLIEDGSAEHKPFGRYARTAGSKP